MARLETMTAPNTMPTMVKMVFMRGAKRFRGTPVPLPDDIRTALSALVCQWTPDVIDRVCVLEHSAFARMHGRATATTRPRCIFLRGRAADFFADPALILHEYCHVLSQWETGTLTVSRYLGECLRRGYWNNRYEVEARAFAERNLAQFRSLLGYRTGEGAEWRCFSKLHYSLQFIPPFAP